jgi:hypothetical protein
MRGLCKLCLKSKGLQKSHLIPAFAYRIVQKESGFRPGGADSKARWHILEADYRA